MAASIKTWLDNDDTIEVNDVDLNGFKNENNILISSSGQILNINDNNQTSTAVAYYVAVGEYFIDSGAGNAYVLNATDSRKTITNYSDGVRVSFIPQNTNTGASTVNVAGIGIKNIVMPDETTPITASIRAGEYISMFYDGVNFRIIGEKHSIAGGFTGETRYGFFATAPAGWLLYEDGSIGSSASAATLLASQDTQTLYEIIYSLTTDAEAPVSGGRTGNAENDFNANKTLTLPKNAGRVPGSAGAGVGLTTRSVGEAVGEETHLQTASEVGIHSHALPPTVESQKAFDSYGPFAGVENTVRGEAIPATEDSTGGVPFNIMQPTAFRSCIIKL